MGENVLIRISALALALAALGMTAACNSETDPSEPAGTDYIIDADTGEERMVIATASGNVAMRSGPDVPLDLPAGFSLPQGATVTRNTVVDQVEGRGGLVTFTSALSPDDIAAVYREQAGDAAVALEIDRMVNGTLILGGRSDTGTTFSMTARTHDGRTQAQLIVGQSADR